MNLLDIMRSEADDRRAEAGRAADLAYRQAARSVVARAGEVRTYQAMLDSVKDWQPPELPDLSRFDEIFIDLETTGLAWWRDDKMVGAGLLTPDGVSRYLPLRHKLGPNIPMERFQEWQRRELRGKRIVNINTKFDLHNFRVDGIDLEAQGCTFGDVAHYAALLDDHRRKFNQEDLVRDFLGDEAGKLREAVGFDLDPSKFAEYPAGLVAPRAEHDVLMVARLQAAMWPQLTEQSLHRVRVVEDAIIPVVVEMEHNGCPIDQDLLRTWLRESEEDMKAALLRIQRACGVAMNSPDTREDMEAVFNRCSVPIPLEPDGAGGWKYTFADKRLKDIEHPVIQDLRCAKQLFSLRNKFLIKYERCTARDGILRYSLHQLRYGDDEGGGGGAVSGRFSSAAPTYYDDRGVLVKDGVNTQQIFAVRNQQKERPFTAKYLVRKLHVPAKGQWWMAADASQIEYRGFAHVANAKPIIDAYRNNPDTDYHQLVADLIKERTGKDLHREHVKRINFAQVYGAGVPKMASQLDVPPDQIPTSEEWGAAIREGTEHEIGGPEFQKVVALSETYHEMFPEVKPVLSLASHLAMPHHKQGDRGCGRACRGFYARGIKHRGYVLTTLGRRARFGEYDRHYSAANRAIQGTAADINKIVMIEVNKRRRDLGLTLRITNHDELDADLQDPGMLPPVREVFNTQYLDFKVPIRWEVGIGPNWAEAK